LSDFRNTDGSADEQDRVVGYTAVEGRISAPGRYTAAEREFLLELAHWSLKMRAHGQEAPEATSANVPPRLMEKRACFVTLTRKGKLRGCIGQLTAQEPLYQAVIRNARNAARDHRFPSVGPEEADGIDIEISVLTEPTPVEFASAEKLLDQLQPKEDGVVLKIGAKVATFLPQVWAHFPGTAEFLNQLARKAGCKPDAWQGPDVTISLYRVESFHDGES
jgi:AmmeMemoRadiSam system protein A